jgi:hypothetical protein
VKERPAPWLETRRDADFAAELQERGRSWIPSWGLADTEQDFGKALLAIAARFSSEVAERLDGAGEKMKRGFLDWLAIRGLAARPARMPVVFKLADSAQGPVAAEHPVRLQVGVQDVSVVFETQTDLDIIPGRLDAVVGADPAADAFYLPPPGLSDLGPPTPVPAQWQLKSFAAPGSTTLQLDPALALAAGMLIEIAGQQYRIAAPPKDDLITIDPPVPAGDGFGSGTAVDPVATFVPFEKARNQQNHVLYLGDEDLLNIEAGCTLDVIGGQNLGSDATWEYFGKVKGSATASSSDDIPQWRTLIPAPRPQQKTDAIVLIKGQGSIEPYQIGMIQARWIRARKALLPGTPEPFTPDSMSLRVNAPPPGSSPTPTGVSGAGSFPPVDIFVNAAPSANRDFYPLGREPRLFDTLYVGCAEALSKSKALVDVHFSLAEPSFIALAAIAAGGMGGVLAGVDVAGALHLFAIGSSGALTPLSGRGPLLPSSSGTGGSSAAQDIHLTSVGFRPLMWMDNADLHVVVAAGNSVWDWKETRPAAAGSAWLSLGSLPAPSTPSSIIEGLVAVTKGSTQLVALREKRLWIHGVQGSAPWQPLPAVGPNGPLDIVAIAPVISETAGVVPDTLLAIATDGATAQLRLWAVRTNGTVTKLIDDVSSNVTPFAMVRASGVREVIAVSASNQQFAARQNLNAVVTQSLGGISVANTQIGARIESGQLTAYCVASVPSAPPELVAWKPFDTNPDIIFRYRPNPSIAIPKGTLALYGDLALLPGTNQGEILAAALDGMRTALAASPADLKSSLAIRPPLPALAYGDTVVATTGAGVLQQAGVEQIDTSDGRGTSVNERFVWLDAYLARDTSSTDVYVFQTSLPAARFRGTATGTSVNPTLDLDAGDLTTGEGPLLVATTPLGTRKIVNIVAPIPAGTPRVASLDVPAAPPTTTVYYWAPIKISGRIVPALGLTSGNNYWPVDILDRDDVYFPGLDPKRQRVIALALDTSSPPLPLRLAFESAWTTNPLPGNPISFILDTTLTGWLLPLGDSSSNPALAWEYWNGTGWWTLVVSSDTTHNLRQSGVVEFHVPPDLKATDWSGKTNFWIRARLIGGDYGHETVTVILTPITGGGTKEVVTRSTEGIQAPYAISVEVSYQIKDGVLPAHLLTLDSGTLRDQSDANRTSGARVEVFTPLAVTLSRLEQGAQENPSAATPCTPDCECKSGDASTSASSTSGATAFGASAASAASPAPGRALYLGFSASLSGASVNVLLLVDRERSHDALAPLRVDALQGDHFAPVTVSDTTRALGESGVLSMSFAVPSASRELFGRTLSWLRLMPSRSDPTVTWNPGLKGAYLNAVWASATETLTRELVGSSEGAPNLTLQLQRPPVLNDTLELRVKEPLSSEERATLKAADKNRVLSDVENLPGDWVLWQRAIDPGDEAPTARVYALDEQTGVITFGDGKHGMIPPIGRDVIVAFAYQRTEVGTGQGPDVPGNSVAPRTPLDLVSPVESVEAVIAADQAAGGAPPETSERVLRFGGARLRHRERALVARDFEDLALESSPKFVQARAFVRPGRVRLVVVKRGPDPSPNAAERRELRRLLLAVAPPWLGVPRALAIEGPGIRRLRVELVLEVENLDHAGGLAIEVKKRMAALFDAVTGGIDRDGWPLGVVPRDDDVAWALSGAPDLVGIASVTLLEIATDGTVRRLPAAIKADELVVLAADGVRLDFTIVETLA